MAAVQDIQVSPHCSIGPVALAASLLVLLAYLTANGQNSGVCVPGSGAAGSQQPQCDAGHPYVPVGPDGEAVADSYYLVGQPLSGNGTMTSTL